jgi:hypothetical protein
VHPVLIDCIIQRFQVDWQRTIAQVSVARVIKRRPTTPFGNKADEIDYLREGGQMSNNVLDPLRVEENGRMEWEMQECPNVQGNWS